MIIYPICSLRKLKFAVSMALVVEQKHPPPLLIETKLNFVW